MNCLLQGLDICASMDQFERYENLSISLALKDKQFMEETSGCLYPCTYMEYKVWSVSLNKINSECKFHFQILDHHNTIDQVTYGVCVLYASVTITVKNEVKGITIFFVGFVSWKLFLTLKTELSHCLLHQVISYDIVSLVSDIGGTLGLFVGFSFFAFWDIVKDLYQVVVRPILK